MHLAERLQAGKLLDGGADYLRLAVGALLEFELELLEDAAAMAAERQEQQRQGRVYSALLGWAVQLLPGRLVAAGAQAAGSRLLGTPVHAVVHPPPATEGRRTWLGRVARHPVRR